MVRKTVFPDNFFIMPPVNDVKLINGFLLCAKNTNIEMICQQDIDYRNRKITGISSPVFLNKFIKYLVDDTDISITVMGFIDLLPYFFGIFRKTGHVGPDFFHFIGDVCRARQNF